MSQQSQIFTGTITGFTQSTGPSEVFTQQNQPSLWQIAKSTGKVPKFAFMYTQSTLLIKLTMTWRCKYSGKTSTGANYSALVVKMQWRFFSSLIQQLLRIHSSAGRQMLLLVYQSLWISVRSWQKLPEQWTAWQVTQELTQCQGALQVFVGTWSITYKQSTRQSLIFSPKKCQTAWLQTSEDGSTITRKLALYTIMVCLLLLMHENFKATHCKQHRFKFIVILL
jgi:hypothetical protein